MSLIRVNLLYTGTTTITVPGYHKVTYSGHVNVDGEAFGWGTAKDRNGKTYTGTFNKNMMHGVGKSSIPLYSLLHIHFLVTEKERDENEVCVREYCNSR